MVNLPRKIKKYKSAQNELKFRLHVLYNMYDILDDVEDEKKEKKEVWGYD